MSPVKLDSFRHLKYLTFGSFERDFVLPYAIRQFELITTKCNVTQITFDINVEDTEHQLNADVCRTLDDILTGKKFPSLKAVYLHRKIPFLFFPKLSRAGLLKVCSISYWHECVQAT